MQVLKVLLHTYALSNDSDSSPEVSRNICSTLYMPFYFKTYDREGGRTKKQTAIRHRRLQTDKNIIKFCSLIVFFLCSNCREKQSSEEKGNLLVRDQDAPKRSRKCT